MPALARVLNVALPCSYLRGCALESLLALCSTIFILALSFALDTLVAFLGSDYKPFLLRTDSIYLF